MMLRGFLLTLLTVLAGLLGGCAMQPPAPPVTSVALNDAPLPAFSIDGRLAMHAGKDSGQMSLHWRHTPQGDTVELYSPLGQTLGRLTRDASGASLTDSSQHTYYAHTLDSLSRQRLGWSLPFDGLADWVSGAAVPQQPYEVQRHAADAPLQMQQSGWTVTYLRWRMVGDRRLPDRIDLVGDGVRARLLVSQWQVDP
ncbi:MAG: lipoprotein insertase outer membrane protein LolB [Betaproteobacteria bacterium]|nr:lipoprotein insertase outer membrane protein LolB [Betaproteobacteria bacterium]